jgi:hypothetical protein
MKPATPTQHLFNLRSWKNNHTNPLDVFHLYLQHPSITILTLVVAGEPINSLSDTKFIFSKQRTS